MGYYHQKASAASPQLGYLRVCLRILEDLAVVAEGNSSQRSPPHNYATRHTRVRMHQVSAPQLVECVLCLCTNRPVCMAAKNTGETVLLLLERRQILAARDAGTGEMASTSGMTVPPELHSAALPMAALVGMRANQTVTSRRY